MYPTHHGCRVLALLMLCDLRLDKQDVHDLLEDCQKPPRKVRCSAKLRCPDCLHMLLLLHT